MKNYETLENKLLGAIDTEKNKKKLLNNECNGYRNVLESRCYKKFSFTNYLGTVGSTFMISLVAISSINVYYSSIQHIAFSTSMILTSSLITSLAISMPLAKNTANKEMKKYKKLYSNLDLDEINEAKLKDKIEKLNKKINNINISLNSLKKDYEILCNLKNHSSEIKSETQENIQDIKNKILVKNRSYL